MEKVIEKYWEFGIEKKMAFGRSRQWTLNGSVWDNNYYGKHQSTDKACKLVIQLNPG